MRPRTSCPLKVRRSFNLCHYIFLSLLLKVITESLSRQCKCHGVSGSCSIRTCFKSLPSDMRPVAHQLRNRYSVAVHVDPRSGVRHEASSRGTGRTSRRRRGHRNRETSGSNTAGECLLICALEILLLLLLLLLLLPLPLPPPPLLLLL